MKANIKLLFTVILGMIICSCNENTEKMGGKTSFTLDPKEEAGRLADSEEINKLLDSFNVTAARADYDKYFSYLTESATFMGTDATENWDKKTYMAWAKPYFDAKTTWDFKSVKRNIHHFGKRGDIAWFDELLSTAMKICRGSGVVVKQNGEWKIEQYVLSMTVPNSQLNKIVKIKTSEEDSILRSFKK